MFPALPQSSPIFCAASVSPDLPSPPPPVPARLPNGRPLSFQRALSALSSSASWRDLKLGSCVHAAILKSGSGSDVIASNSLLNMYGKCGCVGDALRVFDEMPDRSVVTWTSLMSVYSQLGDVEKVIIVFRELLQEVKPHELCFSVILKACARESRYEAVARAVHASVIKMGYDSDEFLKNLLVSAYAKLGRLVDAEKIVVQRDGADVIVSWTSLVSGAVLNGNANEALRYFFMMQEFGIRPNEVTLLSILRACSLLDDLLLFKWVHGLVLKAGLGANDVVANSLVEMHLGNGYFTEGVWIFCKYLFPSDCIRSETIALILRGCTHLGFSDLGKQIHCFTIKQAAFSDLLADNALISMYGGTGCCDSAVKIFRRMVFRDIISWNSIICCLIKYDKFNEALRLFKMIVHDEEVEGVSPDFVTVLELLQGCSNLALYDQGQLLHGYSVKTGIAGDLFVQNSLIDFYGKMGRSDFAADIFEDMQIKDIGTYNSMLAAYGLSGDGISALKVFEMLKSSGLGHPNEITFTNVLSACGHSNLISEGLEIFRSMENSYCIMPNMDHYACVVAMLAKSGKINGALSFIKVMPQLPDAQVWSSLLVGSGIYNRVDVAETAAKWLSILDPQGSAWRVTLSNAYASAGRWRDVAKVRVKMKDSSSSREAGCSSVLVQGNKFDFVVNDTRHPKSRTVYEVLDTLMKHSTDSIRA
ncbi:hypothetical protein MLD38_013936 [Melastoma candidum]|uniref:Uncharacterized protein n=1 Tax=Melastoma candidum TaxID=119954 RepID=A0ACB9RBR9_9MYRT|nr:hypothetical protein MLD38_013936 [Melastoma candidum]